MKKKSIDQLLEEYPLQTWGDNPVLRTKCDTITIFDKQLKNLAQDMRRLMRIHYGTWLAAPQIGLPIQLITTIQRKEKWDKLIEIGETVLVNPTIIQESDEEIESEEACLSLGDIQGIVKRKERVVVSYQDLQGNAKQREFVGYNATVLQHEIDHLQGTLFIDRLV